MTEIYNFRQVEAISNLIRWREINDRRNEYIMWAEMVGISKSEIYRLTGISRSTIDRVVNS